MKHTSAAASRRPALTQAQRRGRRPSRKPPTTTGKPPALGTSWVGDWHLDVDEQGRLIAVNGDTGTTTVLAGTEG